MSDTLTREDIKKWAKNALIFSAPAIIAFLTSLQTNDFQFALGAGYSALLAAGLDLYGKYKSGVPVVKVGE